MHMTELRAGPLKARLWAGARDQSTTCLFVHGFGDTKSIWDESAFRIADVVGVNAVALDLMGHGDSPWLEASATYCLDSFVQDVLAAVADLKFDKLILVGHSLGGRIALCAAEQLRSLVGLVLVEAGPELALSAIQGAAAEFGEASEGEFDSLTEFLSYWSARRPLVDRQQLARIAMTYLRETDGRLVLKADPRLRDFIGQTYLQEDAELWACLGRLSCNVAAIRGVASGALTAAIVARMLDTQPRTSLEVIKRAGHCVMLENPHAFVEALCRVLVGWLPFTSSICVPAERNADVSGGGE